MSDGYFNDAEFIGEETGLSDVWSEVEGDTRIATYRFQALLTSGERAESEDYVIGAREKDEPIDFTLLAQYAWTSGAQLGPFEQLYNYHFMATDSYLPVGYRYGFRLEVTVVPIWVNESGFDLIDPDQKRTVYSKYMEWEMTFGEEYDGSSFPLVSHWQKLGGADGQVEKEQAHWLVTRHDYQWQVPQGAKRLKGFRVEQRAYEQHLEGTSANGVGVIESEVGAPIEATLGHSPELLIGTEDGGRETPIATVKIGAPDNCIRRRIADGYVLRGYPFNEPFMHTGPGLGVFNLSEGDVDALLAQVGLQQGEVHSTESPGEDQWFYDAYTALDPTGQQDPLERLQANDQGVQVEIWSGPRGGNYLNGGKPFGHGQGFPNIGAIGGTTFYIYWWWIHRIWELTPIRTSEPECKTVLDLARQVLGEVIEWYAERKVFPVWQMQNGKLRVGHDSFSYRRTYKNEIIGVEAYGGCEAYNSVGSGDFEPFEGREVDPYRDEYVRPTFSIPEGAVALVGFLSGSRSENHYIWVPSDTEEGTIRLLDYTQPRTFNAEVHRYKFALCAKPIEITVPGGEARLGGARAGRVVTPHHVVGHR